jgi:hypothetical protein
MVFSECVEVLDGTVKTRHADVVKAIGPMT